MEKTNRVLNELLVRTILLEDRRDAHVALTEVLFHANLLNFDDKGLSLAYMLWCISAKEHTPAPVEMKRSSPHLMADASSPAILWERVWLCFP